MATSLRKIDIWVDGSVYPANPGIGGWGAVLISGENFGDPSTELHISGQLADNTTNNQAETSALTHAIKRLTRPCDITFYTDSYYVVKGLEKITNGKEPISNLKYWRELKRVIKDGKHKVSWVQIKGHAGYYYNEVADKLAFEASKDGKEVSEYINTIKYKDRYVSPNTTS